MENNDKIVQVAFKSPSDAHRPQNRSPKYVQSTRTPVTKKWRSYVINEWPLDVSSTKSCYWPDLEDGINHPIAPQEAPINYLLRVNDIWNKYNKFIVSLDLATGLDLAT